MNRWQFLSGDVNCRKYGGKWFCELEKDTKYHIIELTNLWDAMGKEGQPQYSVTLAEIDLSNVPQKQIDSALACCGWPEDRETTPLMIAESLSDYGLFSPMGSWDGNNYRALIQFAKSESNRLTDDADYHRKQSNRPVNRIGSTALEASTGDYNSALVRGIARGDTTARLLGKIQGLSSEDMDTIGPEYADFTMTASED